MKPLLSAQLHDMLIWAGTFALAVASFFVARLILRQVVARLLTLTTATWDDALHKRGVFEKIGWLAPALVVYASISYFAPGAERGILRILQAYSIGVFVIVSDSLLSAVNDIYSMSKAARDLPIKGYLQVVKLILYLAGVLVVVAILLRQSPWVFLSGLGAATAVLLLVFKDTLLSFVASVQLATNDMIRLGDWIEIPKFDADGEVIDVALHTVKVQNWDMTITSIPTYKLIDDAFKNWRGMQSSGARRIKRAITLDVTSIKFVSEEDIANIAKIDNFAEQIAKKGDGRLTNVGRFRLYLVEWLRANPHLRKDMSLVVRQLASGPLGLPLEIYAYTNETRWAEYEAIQSDIFDHVLAIAPEFGLRIFQGPTNPPR
jgi:miniconductance mechanosensitive channel